MDKVFLDTSGLVAFFDKKDVHHAEARGLFEKIARERIRIIMTDYVLNECITMVLMRKNHATAVKAGDFIFDSKALELVWLDEEVKRKAWEYCKRHSDKNYSFTDCTSFVLMKEVKVTKYLSFDDHFKQAGFTALV